EVSKSRRRPVSASAWRTSMAQRFLVDAEIAGDMSDRAAGLEDEPDRALAQLIGVLPRGCHDSEHLLPPGRRLVREHPRNSGCFRAPPAAPAVGGGGYGPVTR